MPSQGQAALDVLLVRIVGAGMLSLARAWKADVPAGTLADATPVVAQIASRDPAGAAALIETVVRDLWTTVRHARLSAEITLQHLQALPQLISHCSFDADAAVGLIAQAQLAQRRGKPVEAGRHAAQQMVAASRAVGYLDRKHLSEPVTRLLLDSLFTQLLIEQPRLNTLRPAIEQALGVMTAELDAAAEASPHPDSAADTSPTGSQPSEVRRLPAVLMMLETARGTPEVRALQLVEGRLAIARDLETRLQRASQEPALSLVRSHIRNALQHLSVGAPAAAEQSLADAEVILTRLGESASIAPEAVAVLTAEMRQYRALVMAVCGDWRKTASHYANAAKMMPPGRRIDIWRLRVAEARALMHQGDERGDLNALFEAAQIHAEAGALISEQDAPREWAEAHIELGELLLLLGEQEERPERYLAAALHLKPAAEVLLAEQEHELWACAQLGLADALRGLGEFQGDVVTLGDAAFAYRAALGVLTRDRHPVEWVSANAALGATLVRMGEETGDTEAFEQAVPVLKKALQLRDRLPARCDEAEVEAVLGRALLGLFEVREDLGLLEEAATLLRSALARAGRVRGAARATTERALGTALWALHEPGTDGTAIEEAMAAKASALEYYEQAGEESLADRVREEIEALRRLTPQTASAGVRG